MIAAWDTKYEVDFWRPITGIREAANDGNPNTTADPNWEYLGAPGGDHASATDDFTPPFPAYISGHATMGGAILQVFGECSTARMTSPLPTRRSAPTLSLGNTRCTRPKQAAAVLETTCPLHAGWPARPRSGELARGRKQHEPDLPRRSLANGPGGRPGSGPRRCRLRGGELLPSRAGAGHDGAGSAGCRGDGCADAAEASRLIATVSN